MEVNDKVVVPASESGFNQVNKKHEYVLTA